MSNRLSLGSKLIERTRLSYLLEQAPSGFGQFATGQNIYVLCTGFSSINVSDYIHWQLEKNTCQDKYHFGRHMIVPCMAVRWAPRVAMSAAMTIHIAVTVTVETAIPIGPDTADSTLGRVKLLIDLTPAQNRRLKQMKYGFGSNHFSWQMRNYRLYLTLNFLFNNNNKTQLQIGHEVILLGRELITNIFC